MIVEVDDGISTSCHAKAKAKAKRRMNRSWGTIDVDDGRWMLAKHLVCLGGSTISGYFTLLHYYRARTKGCARGKLPVCQSRRWFGKEIRQMQGWATGIGVRGGGYSIEHVLSCIRYLDPIHGISGGLWVRRDGFTCRITSGFQSRLSQDLTVNTDILYESMKATSTLRSQQRFDKTVSTLVKCYSTPFPQWIDLSHFQCGY